MDLEGRSSFGNLSSAPDGSIIEHIFDYVTSILYDFYAEPDENENAITNK